MVDIQSAAGEIRRGRKKKKKKKERNHTMVCAIPYGGHNKISQVFNATLQFVESFSCAFDRAETVQDTQIIKLGGFRSCVPSLASCTNIYYLVIAQIFACALHVLFQVGCNWLTQVPCQVSVKIMCLCFYGTYVIMVSVTCLS